MADNRDEDEYRELQQEYSQLAGERGTFEQHWDEVAQYVLPAWSGSFQNESLDRTPGQKLTAKQFDTTAATGLERFISVVESLLTPEASKWHKLQASVPELNKDRDVRAFFEALNNSLFQYRYAPKANFVPQNGQVFMSLGAFGTGSMFIDAAEGEPGLRYRSIHLGETFFVENHQGIIDKVIRRFQLTSRQAQSWFKADCPKEIIDGSQSNAMRKYWFLHCVKPNSERDPKAIDYKGMGFSSYYAAEISRKVIRREGFRSFPYAIARDRRAPGEIYGRSPAMRVLPGIKTLNDMKKTVLKQGQRTVDPVLLLHDDGVMDGFNMQPGAANYGGVTADGRPLVHTLPVGNIAIGKDMMDDERLAIKDAFLETIFQILTEHPEMTATEVVERVKEKNILLSPTIGRQNSEYLGPGIEREIDLFTQQRLLPPMPPALIEAKGQYKIVYTSPLAKAAQAEEASGLLRTIEWAGKTAMETQNPEIMDHFNWDVIVPEMADIGAVPISWINAPEAVMAKREQRAQQMQQQQMIDAAPAASGLVKAMGGT